MSGRIPESVYVFYYSLYEKASQVVSPENMNRVATAVSNAYKSVSTKLTEFWGWALQEELPVNAIDEKWVVISSTNEGNRDQ